MTMEPTKMRCRRCGGLIFLQESLDLEFENEFTCSTCGHLFWKPKKDNEIVCLDRLSMIIRADLVAPENHSGIIENDPGKKKKGGSKSKKRKKRIKKFFKMLCET